MRTVVTGKKQVTIPAEVAKELGIQRGTRIEWSVRPSRKEVVMRVLPSRGEVARSLWGICKSDGPPGWDAVAELIAERVREDEERTKFLEDL